MDIAQAAARGTATASLDEATRHAIATYRFSGALEAQFRDYYLKRSLPRAQSATAIYLGLIVVITAINILGGMAPLSAAVLEPIYVLRLGVACPALILILATSLFPPLHRHYDWIVSVAVVVSGLGVMAISGIAAAAGAPQFQMGDVFVIAYATMFLGLLFRAVVWVSIALITGFAALGILLGVAAQDLAFAGSVLGAMALMCALSAGRLERLERTSFLETLLLNDIAERDGLSGLYNRRMFDVLARQLWQQARRDRQALQIILVDIDHFKPFNDRYGHQAGDHCIRLVANVIAGAAKRPLDFCARYGGEEFALVLYAPSEMQPEHLAEKIRREISALAIPHASSSVADVITVSIGSAIAEPGTSRSLEGLIQTADEALYRAKQTGRNRVLHAALGESETPTGAFRVFAVK